MPRQEISPPKSKLQTAKQPRLPYALPRPWSVKAVSDGYAIFAANSAEVMRFTATANPEAFPEHRNLDEARAHAQKMLSIVQAHDAAQSREKAA